MFGLVSKERYESLDDWRKAQGESLSSEIICLRNDVTRLENRLMRANVKITSYEKRLNIHTTYWQDKAGRWRDPKTGYCVKASVVMEAQLRKENKAALKRKEADDKYKTGQAQASKSTQSGLGHARNPHTKILSERSEQ